LDILQLVGGFLLLIAGGNLLVSGAIGLARRLGISPLLVGLVIVGFGTSTPELVSSVTAALRGSPGIAIGGVVGSNIANVFLIVGIGALLAPIRTPSGLGWNGVVLLGSALAFAAVVLGGGPLGRLLGLCFLVVLAGYVLSSYAGERRDARHRAIQRREAEELIGAATLQPEQNHRAAPSPPPVLAALSFLAGVAGVLIGADLMVVGAVALAQHLGLSEAAIGVTVVAIGNTLPEMTTTVVAAHRGHGDVALGNVIGSNIFNILGVLGVTAVVMPMAIPPEIARLDLWVMLAGSVLLLLFAGTGRRISRAEGLTLLAGYIAYWTAVLA